MSPRSQLYVPGDRPDRFDKACDSGADAVIIDLEDAVAVPHKKAALASTVDWLDEQRHEDLQIWVRVNRRQPAEVLALAGCARLTGLCLAKVESADEIDAVHVAAPRLRLAPLIESATGLVHLDAIAAAPAVAWLHLGEIDLAADLRITPRDGSELDPYRAMVVLASRRAGLPPPPAPVSPELRNMEAFGASTQRMLDRGFQGRACIHPDQVAVVNSLCTPDAATVERARKLLAAAEQADGAFRGADGQMVDAALLRRASQLLAAFRCERGQAFGRGEDEPPPQVMTALDDPVN